MKFDRNNKPAISTHNIASETGNTGISDVNNFLKKNYPESIAQENEEEKARNKPGPKPAEK